MDIIEKLKTSYPELTNKQKQIVDYILNNPEDICYITLAKLSQRTSSSELTILRLCKKLGLNSFLDLKDEFRLYTQNMVKALSSSKYFVPNDNISTDNDKENLLSEILLKDTNNFLDFSDTIDFNLIINSTKLIKQSENIFIFAHDLSKILGEFLAARLKLLYFNVNLIDLNDLKKTHNVLNVLTNKDVVIIFSFPKYFYPLKNIAKKINEKSIQIITITDSLSSPSSDFSKYVLLCKTNTQMFYNSFTIPIALLNLITSYLVIDMIPTSDRQSFLESSLT